MQKKNVLRNTYALVTLSVLAAMTIVCSRFLRIDLGFVRVSLSSVCTIMAGLWFGPVAGGTVGLVADLLGSFMQGYAPNPLITVSAVLWGVIPAVMLPLVKGGRARKILMLCLSVITSCVVCTMGFTYAGLVLIGYDARAILPARLIQFGAMCPIYCVLVCCLYYSPVTNFIRQNMRTGTRKTSPAQAGRAAAAGIKSAGAGKETF